VKKQIAFLLAAFLVGLFATAQAHATGALGATALRTQGTTQAAGTVPMTLQSHENGRRIDGEVFAVLDVPFTTAGPALAEPSSWCEIVLLHLNTKSCRRISDSQGTVIEARVGKKEPQPPEDASLLSFRWKPATKRADYVSVQMMADTGPYDTHDCLLYAEAVPLEDGRTFLHMGYAFSAGDMGVIASKLYLATVGRNKIGFTREGDKYIGGTRAIAERNTMRYYLGVDAYLASLSLPPQQQAEARMTRWFDSTEKYARQLHEIDRDAYLAMKREELKRPQR